MTEMTSGANLLKEVLTDHIRAQQKPLALRKWVESGHIMPGGYLQLDSDPEGLTHPPGTWFYLTVETLPLVLFDLATTTLLTDEQLIGGANQHAHGVALPAELKPPQPGNQVAVLWLNQGQDPLVIGQMHPTTAAMFA